MTSPSTEPVVAPTTPKPASRWEDFTDIFYAPTSVYERRQNQGPWPTIFIITVLITLVTVLTFNALSPVLETELRQAMAKAMAKTPQMTQDMADKSVSFSMIGKKWGVVFYPIGVFIVAFFVWILAKIIGTKETYGGAMVVVAYSSIIGIVQAIVVGAQGLVMDMSKLTSLDQLSLSAARFADKATASPVLYTVLKQLDVFGIWGLVVMAIGVQVTAKTTRERAIVFAVVWWLLVTLITMAFAIRAAAA
jgi:hypothetical protein